MPSDLKTRFNKNRVVVSLHTRSEVKAQKAASALSDRLERYFESLRLERFHSQELSLKFSSAIDASPNEVHSSISDALELNIRLKGARRNRVFARTSARNVGYLIESIGDVDLSSIKPVNAGQFRDHLAVLDLGSEVGVVKRRLGDLNKRENYVFVFCLFGYDTIYYNFDLLVQTV